MKRFTNLLKKEIKELVTKQLIISLAFTIILFNFIGQVSKKEVQKAIGVQTISALDLDGSAGSQALLKGLESARFKILDQSGKTKEQALETAKAGESKLLLVIPAGFGDSLTELKPSEIETYSFMRSFSLIGARGQVVVRERHLRPQRRPVQQLPQGEAAGLRSAEPQEPDQEQGLRRRPGPHGRGLGQHGRRADLPAVPAHPRRPDDDRHLLVADGHLGRGHGEAEQDPRDAADRAHQADLDHHRQDARGRASSASSRPASTCSASRASSAASARRPPGPAPKPAAAAMMQQLGL